MKKLIIVFALLFLAVQAMAESVTYTYDNLNRLVTAVYESGTITYTYDSNGNITQVNAVPDVNCSPTTLYRDVDGDGYGNSSISVESCPQTGYVADNTDCNDDDADEFPGQTWYSDTDGDGYYAGAPNSSDCTRPSNTFTAAELTTTAVTDNCPVTANADQADDDNDGVGNACDAFPGIYSYFQDSDADGIADAWENEKFGDLTTADETTDQDSDGIIDLDEFKIDYDPNISIYQDYVPQADHDQAISDRDTEINYLKKGDHDKSGNVDGVDLNWFAGEYGKTEIDVDNDNDSFSEIEGDCDDTDNTINPDATEACGDGLDNNCDGNVDEGC